MPVGTVTLVSKSEYARMRNCTEGAVRRAVRDGRISLIDGKIDPVAADAQWSRNTRVRMGSVPASEATMGVAAGSAERDIGSGGDYWASKAQREQAEAEMAELKLAEMRGELVRAKDISTELARIFATFREALQQIPNRMAAVLAAETSQVRVHDLLDAEITSALMHLKRAHDD